MIKVALCGCGKMGSQVAEHISSDKETELMYIFDPVKKGTMFCGVTILDPSELKGKIKEVDVVADFTNPESSLKTCEIAVEAGKRVVIGTTGHSEEQKEEIRKMSEKTAIILSPNMSVGVNVFFKIACELASYLKDYDIELIEAHHRYKKDSPSGTAVKLANLVADEIGVNIEEVAKYGRPKGMTGPRTDREIGIHAIRAGDIVGEHTLLLASNNEKIELKHTAQSRGCLASGTVKAIKFVDAKKEGLYDMWDVIGLK
ncbi:MAG: 4-hydroxy-tetrahydrodipicolinate reductase [Candidatus Thorarchaeota archaeon]